MVPQLLDHRGIAPDVLDGSATSRGGATAPDRFHDRSVLDDVLRRDLDDASAEDILRWGFETFAPRIALSASFGSPEGMVLLDLMHTIAPQHTRVFTIDTGRLHQEIGSAYDWRHTDNG